MIDWMHAFVDVGPEDEEAVLAFWSAVSGWPAGEPWTAHPEFHSLEPADGSAYLHVQRIGGARRVHLDLMSEDVDADRDRQVALGAVAGARFPWWQVMSSPAGLPYCLVTERHPRVRPPATTWPGGHRSRVSQVCVDIPADDFDAETAFWQAATGWPTTGTTMPEFRRLAPPPTCPVQFLLQRLGSGPVRAHLDVGTSDLDAEVRRMRTLGARRHDGDLPWVVFTDPVGMPFCVIPRAPD